ncbi:MAG: hypothetical protein HOP33_02015 [Verrucomicrobia bacterium]|nr:hypothetical protein [Verrucomicrobiota bacterium]
MNLNQSQSLCLRDLNPVPETKDESVPITGVIPTLLSPWILWAISRTRTVQTIALSLLFGLPLNNAIAAETSFCAGPFAARFSLTLQDGSRTEAMGPLFYDQLAGDERTLAYPPFFSHVKNDAADSEEYDFAYPLLTFDRFGAEYRWQLFQLLSFSGGQNQAEQKKKSFTLFPLYFQQRSEDPSQNYTALFPIHGQLKGRLFKSEIDFTLWPLYVKTVRRSGIAPASERPLLDLPDSRLAARSGDVTTYNYLYPFFHRRFGDGLRGWQFWPFYGTEHKDVTTKTNSWGDSESIPGHDRRFVMWPFYFNVTNGIGTDNPEHQKVFLPFYSRLRSPQRDSTSYGSPLGVTITEDRGKKYHEVDAPWPLIVKADGEGKFTRRVWPFYSHATNATSGSDWILWLLYKRNRIHVESLDRTRTRLLLYVYSHTEQKNTETGRAQKRTDVWPLFTRREEFNGSSRLQFFAPLEPFLSTSKSIERNYSPVWSVWRAETNTVTRASSRSLLWNLYRGERTPTTKKGSLLFGLFQYSSAPEARQMRLFFIPIGGGSRTNLTGKTTN